MINKKLVIIVTIITTMVVTGIVYFSLIREDENQYTFSEQTVENQVKNEIQSDNIIYKNTIEEDVAQDVEKQEKKTEKIENEEKEELDKNKVSESTTNKEKEEKKDNDSKLTGEDKAIELAKKQWGEDDNTVYYYVEEQVSDNVYIISVRDQATTQDLSTFKVNISKETVEKD